MTHTLQDTRTDVQIRYASNYQRSTLPHLLEKYGLENKESMFTSLHPQQEKAKTRARTAPLKQKKEFSSFLHFDEERARRRQNERDEHCLKLIKDMYRLRDYYYKEYTRRLAEKVEKQRKEIKEKDLLSQEKRMKKEEEERRSSHKLKKRFEYHIAETSPSAVDVPKTDIYYIVGLEDKLVREGKIKTVNDLNKFRLEIEDPQVFFSTFKVNKSTDMRKSTSHSLHQVSRDDQNRATDTQPLTADKLSELSFSGQALRSLSRISEFRESRPDISSESWAITQQFQKQTSMSSLPTSRRKVFLQSELDRRFPKVEMPNLHCFTMDLATKQPDPVEVQQKAELKAKRKQRKTLMRKIAKMYQLAMSNVATSARILSQREDMDMLFNGPTLSDVIGTQHWTAADKSQNCEEVGQPDDQTMYHEMLGPCEAEVTEEPETQGAETVEETQGAVAVEETQGVVAVEETQGAVAVEETQGAMAVEETHGAETVEDFDGSAEVSFPETHTGVDSAVTEADESTKKSRSLPAEERDLPLPLTMKEIQDKSKIREIPTSTGWKAQLEDLNLADDIVLLRKQISEHILDKLHGGWKIKVISLV